jgi:hypothetical protein
MRNNMNKKKKKVVKTPQPSDYWGRDEEKLPKMTLTQRYQAGYCELQTQVINLRREVMELKRMQEAIQEPKTEYKREQLDKYYYVGCTEAGEVVRKASDHGLVEDVLRYEEGNYYASQEEAHAARNKQVVLQQLKDLAMELNQGVELDWDNDNQKKWYIMQTKLARSRDQAPERGLFVQRSDNLCTRIAGVVYCLSDKFYRIAVERIGEEKLLNLFK